jgi:hypothetical protein
MATREELEQKIKELQQRITMLKEVGGIPYDKELEQLQALKAQLEEPAVVTEAKKTGAVEVPAEEEGKWFEFSVTVNPDTLGGGDYYPPDKEGTDLKSRLVDIVTPADKNEQLFIVETIDERLKEQGRGALVHRLDSAAWVLTRTLDNLGVPYTVDGSQVNYRIKLPMSCESEWRRVRSKTGEDKGIRIQNIYAVGKAPTPVL